MKAFEIEYLIATLASALCALLAPVPEETQSIPGSAPCKPTTALIESTIEHLSRPLAP